MSLRTDIQTRIIRKIRDYSFTPVTYDTGGYPAEGLSPLLPEIICNETGGDVTQNLGRDNNYVLHNWRFETVLTFQKEVDVTDFLMGFNLTFTSGRYAVIIVLGTSYSVEHPVTQGSHTGTKATITFVANVKR